MLKILGDPIPNSKAFKPYFKNVCLCVCFITLIRYLANIFVLKMLSALNICCVNSNAQSDFRLLLIIETNTMKPKLSRLLQEQVKKPVFAMVYHRLQSSFRINFGLIFSQYGNFVQKKIPQLGPVACYQNI